MFEPLDAGSSPPPVGAGDEAPLVARRALGAGRRRWSGARLERGRGQLGVAERAVAEQRRAVLLRLVHPAAELVGPVGMQLRVVVEDVVRGLVVDELLHVVEDLRARLGIRLGALVEEPLVVLRVRVVAVARPADLLRPEEVEQRGRIGVADPAPHVDVVVAARGIAARAGDVLDQLAFLGDRGVHLDAQLAEPLDQERGDRAVLGFRIRPGEAQRDRVALLVEQPVVAVELVAGGLEAALRLLDVERARVLRVHVPARVEGRDDRRTRFAVAREDGLDEGLLVDRVAEGITERRVGQGRRSNRRSPPCCRPVLNESSV